MHEHILHPYAGNFVLRTYFGTWQRHDFPNFEKAFMHLRQQPFLPSNFYSSILSYNLRSDSFDLGLYSGSYPRCKKSSIEHPLHPQVWHPLSPSYVLLWVRGTTQTQDLRPPSVCLQFLQQYLYLFLPSFLSLLSDLGEWDFWLIMKLKGIVIKLNNMNWWR